MAMFNLTRKPLKKGSLVRNIHFGSRIMQVQGLDSGGNVILKSYGHTRYGDFIPTVRPVCRNGVLLNPYTVHTKMGYRQGWYQHVVKGDGKCSPSQQGKLVKTGYTQDPNAHVTTWG